MNLSKRAADRWGFPSADLCFQGGLMDRSGGKKEQQKNKENRRSPGFDGNGFFSKIFDCFHVLNSLLPRLGRCCLFQKKVGQRGGFLKPLEGLKREEEKKAEGGLQAFLQTSGYPAFPGNPEPFLHHKSPFGGLSGGKKKAGNVVKIHPGGEGSSV